jgi:membrane fusion protein (multidrug efflux system)
MSTTVSQRDIEATPAQAAPRRAVKRLAGVAALAIMVGGGAWYGHAWWMTGRFMQTTDDAYVGGNVTTISPHVGGFVSRILVADNDHVQRGQVLAQLDRRDYQAAYDKAQAVVAARMAALSNLRARIVLQQAVIRETAAEQAGKMADATFTRIDGARYAYLATTSAGSRQEAQKSQAARQIAEAAVSASDAGLDGARQQLVILDTQIAKAEADDRPGTIRPAGTARLNLGYTEIRSPVEGYVGNRAAQVGAYVAARRLPAVGHPGHGLWVDANFKEDQLDPTWCLAGHAPLCRRRAAGPRVPRPGRLACRPARAPCSASSRPRMRPATSPRSCSACRSASPRRRRREPARAAPGLSATGQVDTRASIRWHAP